MYNAFATKDEPGTTGTTRLHMDMSDAVNIMLHAEACPDGTPGFATWDLFRIEDAELLRKFLIEEFYEADSIDNKRIRDPIHLQHHYLDSTLRRKLFYKYRVFSHRILQRPGDAVFIPAGCAHQVGLGLTIITLLILRTESGS